MTSFSRRSFLTRTVAGSAVLTFAGLAPNPLQAAAAQSQSGRILVVVELAGGNDGLNTIVPYNNPIYRKLRPELGIPAGDVLKISDELGFHPGLRAFADLLEAGQLAIIQGVGYPDPNRSHFESMDIWHTCQRKAEIRTDGWLGRMLEQRDNLRGGDPPALHLGTDKQPFALMSRSVRVPSIRSLDQFRLMGAEDAQFRKAIQELADARRVADNDLLNFVQSSTSSAITASERLGTSGKVYKSVVTYPKNALGDQLQTTARLISSGLQTAVYYVQLPGFDTHSQQPDVHQALLRQLSESVKAFLEDIDHLQLSDRVAVMAFSEFGRRVEQNASDGTDHGTAGPVFLAGALVKAGLTGPHPSLQDLQDGDLKHHTDFRQVYASVLTKWFECDADQILKSQYQPVDVFHT